MDETAIVRYITETWPDTTVDEAFGAWFFSNDPSRKLMFATIVTADDDYDSVSNLNREGVYRLNIGLSRERYESLFGPPPTRSVDGALLSGHDFTALDTFMPHPVYAYLSWIAVINPERTWETARDLLDDAHRVAVEREERRMARR